MGLTVTREEIKGRIQAKNKRLKRYQSRINQYQQNCTFKNNQTKFYRKLNCGRNYERKKFLIRKRNINFGGVSGEKEKNTGKMRNGLIISRGTLNTKRNRKK